MAKEDLVEGIRLAVAKGSSLREAMMSFFNAGYKREDIEDAARAIQTPRFSQLTQTQAQTKVVQSQKVQVRKAQPAGHVVQQPAQKQTQKPASAPQQAAPVQKYQALNPKGAQKISNYNYVPGKAPIVILTAVLFLLVAALISIFIFRGQLTTFLNNLVG